MRNRPLVETPVIISDGSGSDGAGTSPPPKAEVPPATTVAAPSQGSVGGLPKVGPTLASYLSLFRFRKTDLIRLTL